MLEEANVHMVEAMKQFKAYEENENADPSSVTDDFLQPLNLSFVEPDMSRLEKPSKPPVPEVSPLVHFGLQARPFSDSIILYILKACSYLLTYFWYKTNNTNHNFSAAQDERFNVQQQQQQQQREWKWREVGAELVATRCFRGFWRVTVRGRCPDKTARISPGILFRNCLGQFHNFLLFFVVERI